MSRSSSRSPRSGTARDVVRTLKPRPQIDVGGGTALTMLVLSCHPEDTIGVDLASGALVRVRVAWPDDHGPDLAPFDVVEARLADEPRARRPGPARSRHRGGAPPPTGDPAAAGGSGVCSNN